jgi:hypothetical protein
MHIISWRENMDDSAYILIANKIEEQDPHTAPKAEDGSIHEAFISHLKLMYSAEEAEIVQHLNLLEAFSSSLEVAEASGKSPEYIEKILADVYSRNGIIKVGNLFCLPPIPLLLNVHQFYPEISPGNIETAPV